MIGKNKVTGEVLADLDPSDEENLYYSLDKRMWEFHEEYPRLHIGRLEFPVRLGDITFLEDMPIYKLSDLSNVFISETGNLFYKEGGIQHV